MAKVTTKKFGADEWSVYVDEDYVGSVIRSSRHQFVVYAGGSPPRTGSKFDRYFETRHKALAELVADARGELERSANPIVVTVNNVLRGR